jgi:hypothetical protein
MRVLAGLFSLRKLILLSVIIGKNDQFPPGRRQIGGVRQAGQWGRLLVSVSYSGKGEADPRDDVETRHKPREQQFLWHAALFRPAVRGLPLPAPPRPAMADKGQGETGLRIAQKLFHDVHQRSCRHVLLLSGVTRWRVM